MRQLLALGLLGVGGIVVFAAVTGNYQQVLSVLGFAGHTRRDPSPTPNTATNTTTPAASPIQTS